MGCSASKSSSVIPVTTTVVTPVQKKRAGDNAKSITRNSTQGSLSSSSLESGTGVRIVSSATSKVSAQTCDSGLGEEYAHVITEFSDRNKQQAIEEEIRPETPDLSIAGTQVKGKKSSKTREKSSDILKELKSQGLLSKSTSARGGGLAFDVMVSDGPTNQLKKPPARLAKLKKKHKKKSQLTKEQLDAKLKAAEERRVAKENELKDKLQSYLNKEKEAHKAIDAQLETKKYLTENILKEKNDRASQNKEAQLKAMQEKLEKKRLHAERVRQQKLLNLQNKESHPNDDEQ